MDPINKYKLFRYSCEGLWFKDPTELTNQQLQTKAEAIEVALDLGEQLWFHHGGSLDRFELAIVKNQVSELLRLQQLINEFCVNPLAFF